MDGAFLNLSLLFLNQSLAGKNSWELASLDMLVSSPRFPVFDLVKGKRYCFRVRSVNKYGVSDPSEPSEPVALGEPKGENMLPFYFSASLAKVQLDFEAAALLLEWNRARRVW